MNFLCMLAFALAVGADDDIVILDDAAPLGNDAVSASDASPFVGTPRLQLGLASRFSTNLSGSAADNGDVSGLEWWNLARARASFKANVDLEAVFEGWVRWGMTGAPPANGTFWGFNVHDVYWQSDVQLREAYVAWNVWRVTLRAGQQLYMWGKNEWGAPADVINPYDLRYDLFASLHAPKDARVPVWSADATYHGDWGAVSFVLVPFFTPNRVFISGHDISATSVAPTYATGARRLFSGMSDSARDALQQGMLGTSVPDDGPDNFSVAARIVSTVGGWDIAGTAWFGWDRTPWLNADPNARTLVQNANALLTNPSAALQNPSLQAAYLAVQQKVLAGDALADVTYRRLARFAVEAETALDPFVLRVDLGYSPTQTFYTQSLTPVALQTARAVVGLDYVRGEALFVSLSAFVQPLFPAPKDALLLVLESSDQSTNRSVSWVYGVLANARWVMVDDVVDARALVSAMPQPLSYMAFAQVSYLGWAPHNLALGALFLGGRNGTAGADFAHDRFAVLQYEGAW